MKQILASTELSGKTISSYKNARHDTVVRDRHYLIIRFDDDTFCAFTQDYDVNARDDTMVIYHPLDHGFMAEQGLLSETEQHEYEAAKERITALYGEIDDLALAFGIDNTFPLMPRRKEEAA